MIHINEIAHKITEEKNNLIARAFTAQIGRLLTNNGIVPIMKEYSKSDIDDIADSDTYTLVMEYGVSIDKLDTTEHDKQIINDFVKAYENDDYDECNHCEKHEDYSCANCFRDRYLKEIEQK